MVSSMFGDFDKKGKYAVGSGDNNDGGGLTRSEEKEREAMSAGLHTSSSNKRLDEMNDVANGGKAGYKIKRPPLKKSISVLMKGKFNAFCEAGTIHGLGNIRR
jgi:hypothetical protein